MSNFWYLWLKLRCIKNILKGHIGMQKPTKFHSWNSTTVTILALLVVYRVSNKFSHTLDLPFADKWFIWWQSLLNTKFTFISYPHFQKLSLGSRKYGLGYSLQGHWRSSSKFTHLLIMDSPDLTPVILNHDSESNGLWKFVLVQKTFSSLISAIFQNPWVYLTQISEA